MKELDQHLNKLLTSPDFVQDPYPVYRALHAAAPVYWCEPWGAWLLTGYDDVMSTYQSSDIFVNQGRMAALLRHLPEQTWNELAPLREHFSSGLMHTEPPDHTRLRNIVTKAFNPRVVEAMHTRIQGVVDSLLDSVQPNEKMDVISDLAFPLPAIVISELLGIPVEDREQFRSWAKAITSFQGTGQANADVALRSQESLLEVRQYLSEIFARRRRKPQDDLISALVTAEEQGDKLNEAELVSTCTTLLLGGHETTTCLIANGILTLLNLPDQRDELRENPSLMPSAIDEMLRYETPLQRVHKLVAKDVEIRGTTINKGQVVLQMLGAANRDSVHFPDPDRFDIRRNGPRNFAFGHGIHFCLGAPLARLEGEIAIRTVIERLPNLRLDTNIVEWAEGTIFRVPLGLTVSF
jgi:cytochrome P450